MRKYTYILLLFIFALAFAACSNNSAGDRIDMAYAAYGDKDINRAQSQLRLMMEEDSISGYSCRDLCRLSIILMKLSEQGYEENIAPAVHCYHRSFEVDADSATEYFSTLPVEDEPFVTILSALSVSLDPEQGARMKDFEVNESDMDMLMLNGSGNE